MRKPRNSFLRFLKTSLENKLVITSTQIQIIQPNLASFEIDAIIAEAEWRIIDEKYQNGAVIYTIIDSSFICSCGKEPVHFHEGTACCGGEECCPNIIYQPDVEVQIAETIVYLKETFAKMAKPV